MGIKLSKVIILSFFAFFALNNIQIMSQDTPDTTKIVANYSEFKSALEDATTTEVYLDTDIIVTALGIVINSAKPSLIIDGTSPIDGSVHSITDHSSALQYQSDTISLRTNSVLKSITLRNITLFGKNYFGTVSVYAIVTNVIMNYENVEYYGPQLTYNIYGSARYKDCYAEIGKFNGISEPGELVEAANVIFEGNTTVTQVEAQRNEIVFSSFSGSVEIARNANVVINTYLESGFFYGGASTNFIVHENATFHYYGRMRFWDGLPFKNVTVNPYALLYIEVTNGLATNMLLRVDGTLNVESESELILINREPSALYATVNINARGADFRNPKRVVLYSPGFRPLYYGVAGSLLINAQQVRYWREATPFDAAGGFDDIPNHHWFMPDGGNIEISGAMAALTAGGFTSFTSNHDQADTIAGAPLNPTSFNQANARVLAFGRMSITAEYVHLSDTASEIIGSSEPGAGIIVSFTNEDNADIVLNTIADASGSFLIPLDYTISDGTVINVKSNKMFLTSECTFTVSNNAFKLGMSSANIEFETAYLYHETQLVRRSDPNWGVVITDSRGIGSDWTLSAKLVSPLSYTDEHNHYVLENALVFIEDSGNVSTLTNDHETLIKSHTTTSDIDIATISWEENRGLLARIEPNTAQVGIPYTGIILWILKDAP